MGKASLWIRPAKEGDIGDIHRLLFCEGCFCSDTEISQNLHQLYVIEKEAQLIGVQWDTKPGKHRQTAVHPMYPQAVVKAVLDHSVDHLLTRK